MNKKIDNKDLPLTILIPVNKSSSKQHTEQYIDNYFSKTGEWYQNYVKNLNLKPQEKNNDK
jgi:hypothetical protein|tara:strand:+ start:212 stop:394 length:183 start_codon:yes stop_codon:yes gene_type:complete